MSNEERLLRLERSNRRLRAGMLGLGIVAVALAVMGAADPPSKVIEANKFLLRDDAGKERAELLMDENNPVLRMFNPDGSVALEMASANKIGNGLWLRNPTGGMGEAMVVDKSETNFAQGNNQNISFHLSTTSNGTLLRLFDKSGQPRLTLDYDDKLGSGITMLNPSGKLRTLIAEGWASTSDESGGNGWRTEPPPKQ